MALVEGEDVEGPSGGRRTRLPIPLNSKRLTVVHLKRLALALDLPMTAASEELRQMVERKLEEQGREPLNVQVILGTTPHDVFRLQDADGIFLTVEEEEEPVDDSQLPDHSGSEGSEEELQTLKAEVEEMNAENATLCLKVEQAKTRHRELWQANCQCLAEYDELITQQEAEIMRLRSGG